MNRRGWYRCRLFLHPVVGGVCPINSQVLPTLRCNEKKIMVSFWLLLKRSTLKKKTLLCHWWHLFYYFHALLSTFILF